MTHVEKLLQLECTCLLSHAYTQRTIVVFEHTPDTSTAEAVGYDITLGRAAQGPPPFSLYSNPP